MSRTTNCQFFPCAGFYWTGIPLKPSSRITLARLRCCSPDRTTSYPRGLARNFMTAIRGRSGSGKCRRRDTMNPDGAARLMVEGTVRFLEAKPEVMPQAIHQAGRGGCSCVLHMLPRAARHSDDAVGVRGIVRVRPRQRPPPWVMPLRLLHILEQSEASHASILGIHGGDGLVESP